MACSIRSSEASSARATKPGILDFILTSLEQSCCRQANFKEVTQGHSIIPGQLGAALQNGRAVSATGLKRSKIFSFVSTASQEVSHLLASLQIVCYGCAKSRKCQHRRYLRDGVRVTATCRASVTEVKRSKLYSAVSTEVRIFPLSSPPVEPKTQKPKKTQNARKTQKPKTVSKTQ